MKLGSASGTLLLLALATSLTASLPGQSPSPAKPTRNSAEQVTPSANEGTGNRKIPCKTPENAATCYWTHGRLSYRSVNFTWLLWKIGTHRLLKICDQPTFLSMQGTGDCADPEFPKNLQRIYDADHRRWQRGGEDGDYYYPPDVFADFEICPLEPERKGERQYACIESAKITFVPK